MARSLFALWKPCAASGVESVALYAEDDATGPWVHLADHAEALPRTGAAAYLDKEAVLAAAKASGTAVHPGYGFLSENAAFAERCEDAGLTFLGPTPPSSAPWARKPRPEASRAALAFLCCPVRKGLRASRMPWPFQKAHPGPLMLKAVSGGGGRGIRPVAEGEDLTEAFTPLFPGAEKAFGDGALYLEQALLAPRHIEVQILGDSQGA